MEAKEIQSIIIFNLTLATIFLGLVYLIKIFIKGILS